MKKFGKELIQFTGLFLIFMLIGSAVLFIVPDIVNIDEIPHGDYSQIKNSELIIAGDSRANRQLDPKLMHQLTSLNSINISQSAHDLYSISKMFLALDLEKKTIILSASSWQLNDGAINNNYLRIESFGDLKILDKFMLYKNDIVTLYVRQFKRFYACIVDRSSVDKVSPAGRVVNRGFENIPCTEAKSIGNTEFQKHPFYLEPNYNGYKKQLLIKAIHNLALLKNCKILIYNGPVNNNFRLKSKKAGVYHLEVNYDNVMKTITNPYSNIEYISYLDNTNIDDQYFTDGQHLCENGAAIFTEMVSREVK